MKFRTLTKEDVELRVQQIKTTKKGACYCDLLIYKNARIDRAILDETFGMFGWQNEYQVVNGNLFCTIKVKDTALMEWICKQDVGVESNMEKEKGQASDAFKRAAFAWGIGVELYSAPKIRIWPNEGDYTVSEGKAYLNCTPYVSAMDVDKDTRKITYLQIDIMPEGKDAKPYNAFVFGTKRKKPTRERIESAATWSMTSEGSDSAARKILTDAFWMTEEDWKIYNDKRTELSKIKG